MANLPTLATPTVAATAAAVRALASKMARFAALATTIAAAATTAAIGAFASKMARFAALATTIAAAAAS
jgi:hypothetical protein